MKIPFFRDPAPWRLAQRYQSFLRSAVIHLQGSPHSTTQKMDDSKPLRNSGTFVVILPRRWRQKIAPKLVNLCDNLFWVGVKVWCFCCYVSWIKVIRKAYFFWRTTDYFPDTQNVEKQCALCFTLHSPCIFA